jgi:E3 ubiquitin-protein ligase UBR1
MAVLESPSFTDLLHEDPELFSDTDDIPIGPRHLLKHFVYIFSVRDDKFAERLLIPTYRMLQRFILPFLRKAVIFTHVWEGVIFTQVDGTQDEPESDRLCRLLGLPTVAEVLDMDLTTATPLSLLVQNWTEERYTNHVNPVYNLHHPAIFEPIGLPKRLDVLLELASKYRCRKCHLVPDDPAMCLLCGKVVCAQSVCCSSETYGEMNIHREEYKSHMCD